MPVAREFYWFSRFSLRTS